MLAGMTLGDVGAVSGSGESAGSFGSSLVFPAVPSAPQGRLAASVPRGTYVQPVAPRVVATGLYGPPPPATAIGEASQQYNQPPTLRPREVKLERPLLFSGKKKELANFLFVMR